MHWYGVLPPNTSLKGSVWVMLYVTRMWYQSSVRSLVLQQSDQALLWTDSHTYLQVRVSLLEDTTAKMVF